jgi:hypothetical protein
MSDAQLTNGVPIPNMHVLILLYVIYFKIDLRNI